MSILIKGIKPPKSCYTCSWYNKVECPVNDGRYYYRAQRHPSCPLIELPPHGRLIDVDVLKQSAHLDGQLKTYIDTWIDSHATVIEAEER